ncbi:ParB/RepB/Spo0J family partition protein [Calothrix sp. PCC 6303]|uniref:ParB/RepB/Spo0J family partition protein n=1 Tax=Calothrix sp. PCC 6303 TaxID=1170562 RepID=UPI0002A035FB|nr:ParB/RepB/Spo0J family partition protein [Calothrix sp. PCC 6303]AFZ04573.1 parB-like partition protein [Calothrix sp. PCC 6303]
MNKPTTRKTNTANSKSKASQTDTDDSKSKASQTDTDNSKSKASQTDTDNSKSKANQTNTDNSNSEASQSNIASSNNQVERSDTAKSNNKTTRTIPSSRTHKTSKKDEPYTEIKKPVTLLFGAQNAMVSDPPEVIATSEALTPTQLNSVVEDKSAGIGEGETLPIAKIKLPASQPRRYFDPKKLEELSRSIKQFGVLEPLLVRPLNNDNFELIAGERRLRASELAGLMEVPVVVKEMDDYTTQQVRLVENLQREDLNPLEETEGILELLGIQLQQPINDVVSLLYRMQNEAKGKITQNVLGKHETLAVQSVFDVLGTITWESFVNSRLPLLKLPEDVLSVLRQGKLEYTKAVAIARVKDDEQRAELLDKAVIENLSLSQVKELIQQLQANGTQEILPEKALSQRYADIGKQLKQAKVWDDAKKLIKVEKLLSDIEKILSGG